MMKGKTGPLALCMIQPEPLPGSYRNMGMKIDETGFVHESSVLFIQ